MPKISFYLAIIISFVLLVSGCSSGGSYKIISGGIDVNDNYMEGAYKSFSGNYYKNIKLDKGDHLTINLNSSTKSGVLSAKIIAPDKNTILDIKTDQSNKNVYIKKTGKYKIKVIGEDHKGSFKLKWNID